MSNVTIASDWKLVHLAKVAKIQTGLAKGKKNLKNPISLPYLRVANVQDGHLDLSEIKYIDVPRNDVERYSLKIGDVLLTEGGDNDKLGRGTVWRGEVETCLHQNHIFVVRPNLETLDPYFLSLLTNSPYGKMYFRKSAKQSTNLASINTKQLSAFPVLLPPLSEQRTIIDIFSIWDEAIAKTERLIAALRERKKGVMQRLLTGQVRFQGFDENWKEDSLGKYANIRRGASPRPISNPEYFAEKGRGWIRISDVTGEPTRFLNFASQYLSELGESKSVKVEVGDLIMSICATIGVPKIVNIPACIHDGFVLFSEYEERFNKEFLYYYIDFITSLLASGGQPGTQKNLNTEIVRKIEIPIISLAEQRKIVDILNTCDEEIGLLVQKLSAIQQQKKGLMQRLLTGQVRVRV